jgi:DNA-binding transcriptional MerR regulator
VLNSKEQTWTITELAEEFDVTLRTIRFYEDRGLITPERRGIGARLPRPRPGPSRADPARQAARLLAEQIAHIVDMYDAEPGEAGQLRYLLAQIEDRRAELELRRRDIEETLIELDEVERRCHEDLARLAEGTAGPA